MTDEHPSQVNCKHDWPPGFDFKACNNCGKVFKAHSYRLPRFDKRGRTVR